jgi:hypothetical protein
LSPTHLIPLFALPLLAALAIAIVGRSTIKGLMLLVALIPLEAFAAIEVGFTIPPSYVILVVILFGSLLKGEAPSIDLPEAKPVIVYLAIAIAATLVAALSGVHLPSVDFDSTVRFRSGMLRSPIQLALLVFHFSLFILIVKHVSTIADADRLLKIHLTAGACLMTVGLYQILAFSLDLPFKDFTWSINLVDDSSTYSYGEVRYYSALVSSFSSRATFLESLHFASYLNSVAPIALALSVGRSAELKQRFGIFTSVVYAVLAILAVFVTMSRSGWLSFAVAATIICIRLSPRMLFIHLPIGALVLAGSVAALSKIGFFQDSFSTLGSVLTGRFDLERILFDPRVMYFMILIESFQQNPVLGVGAGNFALIAPAMMGTDTIHSAHGLLWTALADFGAVGLAALLAVFAYVLNRINKAISFSTSSSERVILVGLFAAICGLIVQSLFCNDRPPFYLILLLGLSVVYASHSPANRVAYDSSH